MTSQGGFAGGSDDQDRLLDEATAVVKEQAFYMKRAMDNDNLREALKHASNLICELRTSLLSPKNYYELYMQVFQEMQHLSNFFNDRSRHNRKMMDLYESVQHAGNIVPRMYLLATVGASYIKSKEAPAKEILKDMSELTKGVQHPIRGLFLRYYLSQMVKDKLPDTGSEYEEAGGGDINDAFDFILTNFIESNRLWVRIQHQGPQKDKARREKERHDLRVLVGANLVRLSQLEGMTVEFYKETALPKLLDHVLSVKDTMSQQYLFESMIQVFPDEFHIATLEQELASYTKAQPLVDMKPIMVTLMNRLTAFLQQNEEEDHALKGVDIFSLFNVHLKAILERTLEPGGNAQPDVGPALELQAAFMQFTLSLFAEVHHVDIIMQSTVELLEKYFAKIGESGNNSKKLSSSAAEKVVDLLSHILKIMPGNVLEMEHVITLVGFLSHSTRKQVALNMVSAVTEGQALKLDSVDTCDKLFNFISPLVRDEDDQNENEKKVDDAFKEEQQKVAKLVYRITADESQGAKLDVEFAILSSMRGHFGKGTETRMVHVLPPLIYAALGLIERKKVESEENPSRVTAKKIFQFVHKTITALNEYAPLICVQLWLCGSVVADRLGWEGDGSYEPICQEFISQAFQVFEEYVADSKDVHFCILHFIGSLTSMRTLEQENYSNASQLLVKNANKLHKKDLKIPLICACSHLFANEYYEDKASCLQCCQKALKVVDTQVQADPKDVGLWVDMLDLYIHYYVKFPDTFTDQNVKQLRTLAKEHISFALADDDAKTKAEAATTHLNHTEKYVQALKREKPEQYAWWD